MSSYSETVIDHAQAPRNFGRLESPDGEARVDSSCGDWVHMMVQLAPEGHIASVKYLCYGCASALATCSLLSETAQGLSLEEAAGLTPELLLERLGGMPEQKTHCNQLSLDAFHQAVEAARLKHSPPVPSA